MASRTSVTEGANPRVRADRRTNHPHLETSTSASACTNCATRAASRSLSPKRISSVAAVSFLLTDLHRTDLKQPQQRPLRIAIGADAPRHRQSEQYLPNRQPMPSEFSVVAMHQETLSNAGSPACSASQDRAVAWSAPAALNLRRRPGRHQHDVGAIGCANSQASTMPGDPRSIKPTVSDLLRQRRLPPESLPRSAEPPAIASRCPAVIDRPTCRRCRDARHIVGRAGVDGGSQLRTPPSRSVALTRCRPWAVLWLLPQTGLPQHPIAPIDRRDSTDCLVVAEVRLTHPAFGTLAPDPEPLALAHDARSRSRPRPPGATRCASPQGPGAHSSPPRPGRPWRTQSAQTLM